MTEIDVSDLFNVAEVELCYKRLPDTKRSLKVTGADIAYEVFQAAWDMNKMDLQEEFKILLTSNDHSCLGVSHVATGALSQCVVDIRLIFVAALKANAAHIILAHNHPSGNLRASDEDITFTRKVTEAGRLLDIKIADHLILSSQGYLSMSNEGLMP